MISSSAPIVVETAQSTFTLTVPVFASNVSTVGLAGGLVIGGQAAQQHPQTPTPRQKQTPKQSKKDCSPKFRNFFNQLPTFTKLATQLNTKPLFLMAQSSWESGWLGPHAQALHNLFGTTHAGGNDIQFSSYETSANAYYGSYSPYVSNTSTMQDFTNGLRNVKPNGYNTQDPNYYNEITNQQKSVVKHASDCGVSISQ